MPTTKRHHCAWCGADIGPWDRFCDRNDTCGASECEREMRGMFEAEREEAHRQLDEERGW